MLDKGQRVHMQQTDHVKGLQLSQKELNPKDNKSRIIPSLPVAWDLDDHQTILSFL